MVYDSTIKKTCFHQDFVNIDLRVWELPYFKCCFKCLLNHKYNLVFFYWCFSLISGRLCPIWLLKHVIVQEDFFFKFIEHLKWLLAPLFLEFDGFVIHSIWWKFMFLFLTHLGCAIYKIVYLTLRNLIPSNFYNIPGWTIRLVHVDLSRFFEISTFHLTKYDCSWCNPRALNSTFCLYIWFSLTIQRIKGVSIFRYHWRHFWVIYYIVSHFRASKLLSHQVWSCLPLLDI